MASIAPAALHGSIDEPFFRRLALTMAATIVAGFLIQFLAGRSTFAAPPLVHVHGVVFMAWVALFVAQSWLATRGPITLHRKLGRFGAIWVVVLVIIAFWIVIDVTQRGMTPFFFQPQHFLIANPMTAVVSAALVWSAIRVRRHTDWHMRLQICAMAAITGPGVDRILPMPFLIPYAFETAVLTGLFFPVAGMVRDYRREGRVHRAWIYRTFAIVAVIPLSHLIAGSALGDAIYAFVTAGHPGADVRGLAFPPPPPIP